MRAVVSLQLISPCKEDQLAISVKLREPVSLETYKVKRSKRLQRGKESDSRLGDANFLIEMGDPVGKKRSVRKNLNAKKLKNLF